MRRSPPHTKDCRSGVCGSRMTCLGPGREGMGITSLGRDARGLTFSAVIPARVMQPEVSTRGKQNWRIALCCYGMTLAPRHRVHRLCVASLAHLRCAHRLGVFPGRTLLEGEGRVERSLRRPRRGPAGQTPYLPSALLESGKRRVDRDVTQPKNPAGGTQPQPLVEVALALASIIRDS